MALELKQSVKLSQQLVMTPQLQQAIKLLQLSRMELLETINQELCENPVLEEQVEEDDGFESSASPEELETEAATDGSDFSDVTVRESLREDMDWEAYMSEYNTPWSEPPLEDKETPSLENMTPAKADIYSHLMWQLNLSDLNEIQKEIGEHIIGNINEDGYLESTVEDLCLSTGRTEEEVTETLQQIQKFDPVGVAARDMQESLLIQARFHGYEGTIIEKIIMGYLGELERKRYDKIAKGLSVSAEEVRGAVTRIQDFDPRPGSSIYSEERPVYVIPDIYIFKIGDDYQIALNEDGLPKLKINGYYKQILTGKGSANEELKSYIQDKLRSASWLIRSIYQRQRTIYKVAESIVEYQREFFDKGIAYLKPLILRTVAEDIDMHESTVSRVTANKYAYTPQGIFELKFFFNSSVNRVEGDAVASETVKQDIRRLIKSEDSSKPYSDQDVVEMLKKMNINVARRTVAKYRESMGILPSSKRRSGRY